jgi:hypothetical protein
MYISKIIISVPLRVKNKSYRRMNINSLNERTVDEGRKKKNAYNFSDQAAMSLDNMEV